MRRVLDPDAVPGAPPQLRASVDDEELPILVVADSCDLELVPGLGLHHGHRVVLDVEVRGVQRDVGVGLVTQDLWKPHTNTIIIFIISDR